MVSPISHLNRRYSRINLYITGYGPFLSHDENPAQRLVELIFNRSEILRKVFPEVHLKEKRIFEVDCKFVEENLPELLSKVEDTDDSMSLILHFGLNNGIQEKEIHLENVCRNFIDDLKGRKGKVIESDIDSIVTKLDTTGIINSIDSLGLAPSRNTGSYLCNFVYFLSSISSLEHRDRYVQFIHIPDSDVLSLEETFKLFCRYLMGLVINYIR